MQLLLSELVDFFGGGLVGCGAVGDHVWILVVGGGAVDGWDAVVSGGGRVGSGVAVDSWDVLGLVADGFLSALWWCRGVRIVIASGYAAAS